MFEKVLYLKTNLSLVYISVRVFDKIFSLPQISSVQAKAEPIYINCAMQLSLTICNSTIVVATN